MRTPTTLLLLAALTCSPGAVRAQTDCDSLDILAVQYNAFTANSFDVIVQNRSIELFDYPLFRIVNSTSDTLAYESVFFFGIGWGGPQTHTLAGGQDVEVPGVPFEGSLVLFYAGFPEPEGPCVWPMTFDLCPDSACMTMQTYIANTGNALVTADIPWTVLDADNVVVAEGTWHLSSLAQQQDLNTICLPPGNYHLRASNPEVTGGQLRFGVTRNFFTTNGPSEVYQPGGTVNTLAFDFFLPCIESGNAVPESTDPGLTATVDHGMVTLRSAAGTPLGPITVFDAQGRVLHSRTSTTAQADVDLGTMATGAYLVRVGAGAAARVLRIAVLP